MNKLKLTYFTFRGRGEIIRMMLHASNVPFDDHRVSLNYWFDVVKKEDRHIQLPIMTINGKDYPHIQSIPLFNYFASQCDLYGDSAMDRLLIDQFTQYYEEMMGLDVPMFVTPEMGRKAVIERPFLENMYRRTRALNIEAVEKNRNTMYPRIFTSIEKLITSNTKKGSDFCVGNRLSMADLALHQATQTAYQEAPDILCDFPAIRAIRKMVKETNHLKNYLNTRPYAPL